MYLFLQNCVLFPYFGWNVWSFYISTVLLVLSSYNSLTYTQTHLYCFFQLYGALLCKSLKNTWAASWLESACILLNSVVLLFPYTSLPTYIHLLSVVYIGIWTCLVRIFFVQSLYSAWHNGILAHDHHCETLNNMNNFTEIRHCENFSHYSCEMEFIELTYFWCLGKMW